MVTRNWGGLRKKEEEEIQSGGKNSRAVAAWKMGEKIPDDNVIGRDTNVPSVPFVKTKVFERSIWNVQKQFFV